MEGGAGRPDVILTDLHIPQIGGLELPDILKADDDLRLFAALARPVNVAGLRRPFCVPDLPLSAPASATGGIRDRSREASGTHATLPE